MNSLGFLARKQHFFVCFSSKNETSPEIPKFSDLKVYLELETGNWIFGLFPFLTLNKNHQGLMFLVGIILSLLLLWVRKEVGSISFSFSSKIKEKTIEMLIYSPCSSGARTELLRLLAVVFMVPRECCKKLLHTDAKESPNAAITTARAVSSDTSTECTWFAVVPFGCEIAMSFQEAQKTSTMPTKPWTVSTSPGVNHF